MTELVKVNKNLYNKHFIFNSKVDFTKLKLTNEALYSMNNPEESEVLVKIIRDNVKSNKTLTITDGTANGFTNGPAACVLGAATAAPTAAPATPDTGFEYMAAHPLLTLLVSTASAAAIYGISRLTRQYATARAER